VKLFVYHTPELLPSQGRPQCAIAIDVLRASSTIVTALNSGAEAIQVFSDIDQLFAVSEEFPEEKRLRAGERGGRKVAKCDLGNSPLECTPERVEGKRLFMSTTNGTRCLESVQKSSTVLVAALINRQAVVNYLLKKKPGKVWLVGSGWEGTYSLEDTICAGAIADRILEQSKTSLNKLAGNDELIAAVALYRQWKEQLQEAMALSSHGQRLLRLRGQKDVAYCCELDTVDILPIEKQKGILVVRQPSFFEKLFSGALFGGKKKVKPKQLKDAAIQEDPTKALIATKEKPTVKKGTQRPEKSVIEKTTAPKSTEKTVSRSPQAKLKALKPGDAKPEALTKTDKAGKTKIEPTPKVDLAKTKAPQADVKAEQAKAAAEKAKAEKAKAAAEQAKKAEQARAATEQAKAEQAKAAAEQAKAEQAKAEEKAKAAAEKAKAEKAKAEEKAKLEKAKAASEQAQLQAEAKPIGIEPTKDEKSEVVQSGVAPQSEDAGSPVPEQEGVAVSTQSAPSVEASPSDEDATTSTGGAVKAVVQEGGEAAKPASPLPPKEEVKTPEDTSKGEAEEFQAVTFNDVKKIWDKFIK
jgi:2-phosphosulfolactate phosphatase